MAQVHVRYEGQSLELEIEDLGPLSTDNDVRVASARYLNLPEGKFNDFYVDKNQESGVITLRPNATWGCE